MTLAKNSEGRDLAVTVKLLIQVMRLALKNYELINFEIFRVRDFIDLNFGFLKVYDNYDCSNVAYFRKLRFNLLKITDFENCDLTDFNNFANFRISEFMDLNLGFKKLQFH